MNADWRFLRDTGKVPYDPYERQMRGIESRSGRNPLMSLAEGVYSSFTGRSLYTQPLNVTEIGEGDEVVDTALGRYLKPKYGNPQLLMERPPEDSQRYAMLGYTQDVNGKVNQYVAKLPPTRFPGPVEIGGVTMPGKKVVIDGNYLGSRKRA